MIHPGPYTHLGELLGDALIQFKSDVALIEVNRERETDRLTYLDAGRVIARVAARLESCGIGPDDRVAVVMSNQSRWLLTAVAVFARGAVLVPLDHKLSADEQAALIAHCRPTLLVTEYGLWRRFREPPPVATWVTEAPASLPDGVASWDDLPDAAGPLAVVPRTRDDLACIVYSSGTGGAPKGCLLPHRAYLAQLEGLLELFPLERGDRYFSILPTNHAIDFMVGFVGPFVCGATVVHQRALRPEFLRSTLKRYEITHMAVVPLLLDTFKERVEERLDELGDLPRRAVDALIQVNRFLTLKRPSQALSSRLLRPLHEGFGGSLKLLFAGGAFVEPDTVRFLYDLGLPVVVGYGLTEACTVATVNRTAPFRADSVGRAVQGVELHIHDAGADGVGEVWVRGPTLFQGYLDDPEQTAQAIDADGWLHTGDLGYLDAAFHLHLVGRRKNMIVTAGGKNVYPEDVEQHLGGVPCDELAVMAADYVWPRSDGALVGEQLIAVIRADDPDAALADLRRRNLGLAEHKRLSGALFVTDEFPRTASMKVKRDALARRLGASKNRSDLKPMG